MASISSVAAISRLSGMVSCGGEARDIVIGDVPPVLAQMRGDAVRPGLRRHQPGAHRIGIARPARVPDRRDMVDIDAQAQVALTPPRGCPA